jgi:hypothetical protein
MQQVDFRRTVVLCNCRTTMRASEANAHFGRKSISIVPAFCLAVSGLVLLTLVMATVANDFTLLRTSRPGDVYPMTVFGVYPIEGTSPVPGAPGAAGLDFSQVYTSALALRHGESAYNPRSAQFKERLGRPSGYPPLTNWLFVVLTPLSYYNALLVHVVGSLLLFLGASFALLKKTGLARHFGLVTLTIVSLYFLTPIGLSHLERGQFDLVTSIAYVLCFGCVFLSGNQFGMAIVSGLLGATKWTLIPFLGCFSALAFLCSSGRRRFVFFAIPVTIVLATFVFYKGLLEYWTTIRTFEIDRDAAGLSLQHFLPRLWSKVTPILFTLIMLLASFLFRPSSRTRRQLLYAISLPFSLALLCVCICFGTLSYEYHTVSLFGLIPGLVVWVERTPWISSKSKATTCALFGLLLLIAFRVYPIDLSFTSVSMTKVYLAFSLLFLGVSVHTAWSPTLP